jgi:hypothetical protein
MTTSRYDRYLEVRERVLLILRLVTLGTRQSARYEGVGVKNLSGRQIVRRYRDARIPGGKTRRAEVESRRATDLEKWGSST